MNWCACKLKNLSIKCTINIHTNTRYTDSIWQYTVQCTGKSNSLRCVQCIACSFLYTDHCSLYITHHWIPIIVVCLLSAFLLLLTSITFCKTVSESFHLGSLFWCLAKYFVKIQPSKRYTQWIQIYITCIITRITRQWNIIRWLFVLKKLFLPRLRWIIELIVVWCVIYVILYGSRAHPSHILINKSLIG